MPMHDEDEATPQSRIQAAVAALHAATEMTEGGMAVDRPGWRYVPDAYRLLGQLSELAGLLPDMLEHVRESVSRELELNLIAMDAGSPYQDRPGEAVEAMSASIQDAVVAARQLRSGVVAATKALTWAAYGGRQVGLVQGVPQVAVWTAPYPPELQHPSGPTGTTPHAQCECGWPQLPAMVDPQTYAEADDEAHAHAHETGHQYQSQDRDDR